MLKVYFLKQQNLHAFQFPPIYKEPIMFDCRIINLKIFILHNEQFRSIKKKYKKSSIKQNSTIPVLAIKGQESDK